MVTESKNNNNNNIYCQAVNRKSYKLQNVQYENYTNEAIQSIGLVYNNPTYTQETSV